MSQISIHNESNMATIHSSHPSGGVEATKHLAELLKLLRSGDQLKMMVRLEPFVAWEADHTRYLAVVSTRISPDYRPESQSDISHAPSSFESPGLKDLAEEVCILGIDVSNSLVPKTATSAPVQPGEGQEAQSTVAPVISQKAQRSHSTVSPDHHQTIGSRIASKTRKFLTLPKQKNQAKPVGPAPKLAKRPSISSSVTIKLEDLPKEGEEGDGTVHIGLVLPIWADSKISLDGDGGFRIESTDRHHSFKPVSVQAMWSVLQTLLKASENARIHHQLSPAAFSPRYYHGSFSTASLSTTYSTSRESHLLSHETAHSASMTTVSGTEHPGCSTAGSHTWVTYYSARINSQWVREWHLNLDDFLRCTADPASADDDGTNSSHSRRPLSPHMSKHRQQAYSATEMKIRQHLREVMLKVDLEQVNSKEIRQRVEKNLNMDLSSFKSFIDHEILVILGQMDAASEIFDFLFLGTEWNAGNIDELKEKDIGLVVNVTTEITNSFPGNFEYKNIRVNDVEEEPMVRHWEDAFRYISEAKKEKKRVLVHCKMGVSRSASVVIAYAMKANDWNLQQAMDFVKKRRSVVQPNPGFLKQLEEYEGILEASKHRTSFQSLSGSTLSLCDTRTKPSCLDDFSYSNLSRSQSEFSCSTPNLLSPTLPQRTESLRLSSRPAKFYLETSDDESNHHHQHEPSTARQQNATVVKRNSRRSAKNVKWEPIEEVAVKEDQDDIFGLLRVACDGNNDLTRAPAPSTSGNLRDTTNTEKGRSVSLTEGGKPLGHPLCFVRQQPTDFASKAAPVKGKSRQSRFSTASMFGSASSSSASSGATPPAKENKRPVSIHVSTYLKPKDPVQTLVKYFDQMQTRSPHHGAPPAAMHAQVAQV